MKTRLKKEISIALLAVGITAILIYSKNFELMLYLLIATVGILLILGACKASGRSEQITDEAIKNKIERGNRQ